MRNKVSDTVSDGLRFGPLLRDRRRQAKFTQQDMALRMHVNLNTVKNWEYDRTKPDHNLIPSLCALLGIRLHELYQMPPDQDLSALERRIITSLRQLDSADQQLAEHMLSAMVDERLRAREIRLKESFRLFLVRPGSVAAGAGDEVPLEPPDCTLLRINAINSVADGIVRVNGASMEPVYPNGCSVYFRFASAARSGEDVIVDTEDGAVIKRVSADGTLYSVNPDFPYPGKSEQNTLIIRGRVLGVVQPGDYPVPEDTPLLEDLFAAELRNFRRQYYPNV